MIDWPLLVIGAVVAGLVQGISGFGFAMVAVAIWVWAMPPSMIAVLAVFGGLTGQVIAVLTSKRAMNWPTLMPFIYGGVIGVPVGVLLLPHVNANTFKLVMGSVLLVCCPLMMINRSAVQARAPSALLNGLSGFAGGITGGLGGFAGVIPTLWCTWQKMDKDSQRSTVQSFNLAALAMAMAGYLLTGTVTQTMALPMLVVASSLLVPVLIGAKIYRGLNPVAFRQIVLLLLTLSGLAMIIASQMQK